MVTCSVRNCAGRPSGFDQVFRGDVLVADVGFYDEHRKVSDLGEDWGYDYASNEVLMGEGLLAEALQFVEPRIAGRGLLVLRVHAREKAYVLEIRADMLGVGLGRAGGERINLVLTDGSARTLRRLLDRHLPEGEAAGEG
jgi:hypothetical protein